MSIAAAVLITVSGLTSSAPFALAANFYAGWQTHSYFSGIRGYISQPATTSVPAGSVVFNWLNLCSEGNCGQWVQLGSFQGSFAGGSSPSTVSMYWENVDPCGTYYGQNIGAVPQYGYFYDVRYRGDGLKNFYCPNGAPFQGYSFDYRKGSATSTPFTAGVMSKSTGLAMAKTEVQGSPPMGRNYFGCSSLSCSDTSYGIRLHSGGTWNLWTTSSTSSNANPPYLYTYNNYWSFKTCPTSSC